MAAPRAVQGAATAQRLAPLLSIPMVGVAAVGTHILASQAKAPAAKKRAERVAQMAKNSAL